MEFIHELTEKLNPGQTTVITGDQSVYALGKQVQWAFPEKFNCIMWFMGSLHIEMVLGSVIGQWLDGSGWVEVFTKSRISTAGKVESFLTGKM